MLSVQLFVLNILWEIAIQFSHKQSHSVERKKKKKDTPCPEGLTVKRLGQSEGKEKYPQNEKQHLAFLVHGSGHSDSLGHLWKLLHQPLGSEFTAHWLLYADLPGGH